jgi:hypothetical protein
LYTNYKGYLDESGDGKHVFTLSCLLAKADNWQWINLDWKAVLEETNADLVRQGRTEIRRFHAKDLNNYAEDFEGWSPEERKEFSERLIKVFDKPSNRVNGHSESIDLQALVRLIPETADDPIGFSYSLLLKVLMDETGNYFLAANDGDWSRLATIKIALIHDQTPRYNQVLAKSFESQLKDPTFKYASLYSTLVSSKWQECLPLQPADLLASENFKETLRHVSSNERDRKRGRRIILSELLKVQSFGGFGKCLGEDAILELRKLMDENVTKIIKAHVADANNEKSISEDDIAK